MQCPEVLKFEAPKTTDDLSTNLECFSQIDVDFCHSVSIVCPKDKDISEAIEDICLKDCHYYKVSDLPLTVFFNRSFLNNFLNKGKLDILSIDKFVECEDTFAITSSDKILHLSLTKPTFQSLFLETLGNLVQYETRKINNKQPFILKCKIRLDLNEKHESKRRALKEEMLKLGKFNILVKWTPDIPNNSNVCSSSIARYFSYFGYNVKSCQSKFTKRTYSDIQVPTCFIEGEDFSINDESKKNETKKINKQINDSMLKISDLYEWIGVLSLDCDVIDKKFDEYLGCYEIPEPKVKCENVTFFQCQGFLSSDVLEKLFLLLRNSPNKEELWKSMYLKQFVDYPIENRRRLHLKNNSLLFFDRTKTYVYSQHYDATVM